MLKYILRVLKSQIKYCLLFLMIGISLASFVFYQKQVSAQNEGKDVLAIRVVANPEHLSALRWYKSKEFTGSPQSLKVDGYDAIRDGRTVYVNAANIGADNRLYTNIYVISYNQEAAGSTLDIFSRILKSWKFNLNVDSNGTCFQNVETVCSIDSDCAVGDYCLSDKAQVVRDVKRLADMSEIRNALEIYKNENGRYHTLQAGTYIPNKTVSVWPSWSGVFSRDLKLAMPKDPLNKIGSCGDKYNPITCWDENSREFDGKIPDGLPSGSRVYAYSSAPDGSYYNLCAGMESSYGRALRQFACAGASSPASASSFSISGISMPAVFSGNPFTGYVEVKAPNPGNLTWTLTPISDFSSWSAAPVLSATPNLNQKAITAQKAGNPGTYNMRLRITDGINTINQDLTITVRNSASPTVVKMPDFTITVGNSASFVIYGNDPDGMYPLTFNVSGLPKDLAGKLTGNRGWHVSGTVTAPVGKYNVSVTVTNTSGLTSAPMNFAITVANNPPVFTSSPATQSMPCDKYVYVARAVDPDGHAITQWEASGLPPGFTFDAENHMITGTAPESGSFDITITATDQYGSSAKQSYTLKIGLDSFTVSKVKDGEIYVFPGGVSLLELYFKPVTFFGNADASTGNEVVYSLRGNPVWLSINPATGDIQGTPTNNVTHPGNYTITVSAVDNNGVRASSEFNLVVHPNEWCGDGICNSTLENVGNCIDDCASKMSVRITSPANGTTILETDCLVLKGEVTGGTPPFTYTWVSSIDGSLGSGAELRLPPGCNTSGGTTIPAPPGPPALP
jgi:hypothetical protein